MRAADRHRVRDRRPARSSSPTAGSTTPSCASACRRRGVWVIAAGRDRDRRRACCCCGTGGCGPTALRARGDDGGGDRRVRRQGGRRHPVADRRAAAAGRLPLPDLVGGCGSPPTTARSTPTRSSRSRPWAWSASRSRWCARATPRSWRAPTCASTSAFATTPPAGDFDHHQRGFERVRANGVRYASFGLVWDAFGARVCGGDQDVADAVDASLVQGVDANDVGQQLTSPLIDGAQSLTVNGDRSAASTWPWDEPGDERERFDAARRRWRAASSSARSPPAAAGLRARRIVEERDRGRGATRGSSNCPSMGPGSRCSCPPAPEALYVIYPKRQGFGPRGRPARARLVRQPARPARGLGRALEGADLVARHRRAGRARSCHAEALPRRRSGHSEASPELAGSARRALRPRRRSAQSARRPRQRLAERDLVGVLEVGADRQAGGEPGDGDVGRSRSASAM